MQTLLIDWRRPPLWLAGLSVAGLVIVVWFVSLIPTQNGFGYDAFAFWDVRLDDIYGRSFGQLTAYGAFRYSPPIAFVFAAFHLVPWPVFLALWTAVLVGTLVWLGGRWTLASCVFIGIPMSIYEGNIDMLLGASVVLAFRWPAVLSFAILAKVTPGVTLIWFLVRRDWRSFWIALGSTVLIVVVTYPFVGDAWPSYIRMLVDNGGAAEGGNMILRVVLAGALVAWAARSDRLWLVGIAVAIAQPALTIRSVSVGIAALALYHRGASAVSSGRGVTGRGASVLTAKQSLEEIP